MIDLPTHIYNYNTWERQIGSLISETERRLSEPEELTAVEVKQLTGRMKNISGYIRRMETYIFDISQSLQSIAMNGHFTQRDADEFIVHSNLREMPAALLREKLLDLGRTEVIDIKDVRRRLSKLMLQIENKPVKS